MENNYDLIIIGGGAGAFAAAIKANELGAKTLMVNKGLPLGGTCVNVGCVPSKTLLWAAEVKHLAENHHIPGLDIEVKSFDFERVIADELSLVDKLREEKYKKVLNSLKNVTFKDGWAKFASADEIEVKDQRYKGNKFVIATGSTTTVPDAPGLKETGYITHIEALKLKTQPKSMVILGAGPVGLEFGQMYSRFGTKVTILHRSESILKYADQKLVQKLVEILRGEDIAIELNAKVTRFEKIGQTKKVYFEKDGKEQEVEAEEIMLAGGKTPNTGGLGLENTQVKINDKSAIIVNENFQTEDKNVFAVGDVTALPLRLETTAGREGTLVAENALKDTQNKIDYDTVPFTIFTDPQLAGVGLNEDEQMRRFGVCACRYVGFDAVPKAQIIKRTEGLIGMSIHPETTAIMGVHILAPNAGDLIAQAMTLVTNKNTVDEVINSLPMFPTLSEAIKIAAVSFRKNIANLSCCI